MIRKNREKKKMTNIRNEENDIPTDSTDIKRTRKFYKQLYMAINSLTQMKQKNSLKEKTTKAHSRRNNLDSPIFILKIKFVVKTAPERQLQAQMASLLNTEFNQIKAK